MDPWRVHKFGGSSVADADGMERVARIVEEAPGSRIAVVLSACRGVTDGLLGLAADAARQNPGVQDALPALRDRHAALAAALDCTGDGYLQELDADCSDIRGILQVVQLTRTVSPVLRDLVVGYGELWSSRLFARLLERRHRRAARIQWVDARDVIQVDCGALGPAVRWPESCTAAAAVARSAAPVVLVIPGFVARDGAGVQTTLGRNGSDFSAAILGQLLGADEIHIWTDVDGVLSADPRLVPDATVIDSLSYHEAMELAYFGAKVIHPQTMAPAVAKGIPIWIRNTFAPERTGSLICARPDSSHLVKGITSIDRIALVNVEGTGMIGVPGTAQRLFAALREHGISVVLISQGSSEHSICVAVPAADADNAVQVLRRAFASELQHGQIQQVEVAPGCSILAVVGDGMAGTPGVAAQVFGALGNAGVNIRAIAQGASERNISVVIDAKQTTRALRSLHARFYLSPHTISVGLVGPGSVGSSFIEQLASERARLKRQSNLDIRLRGICRSRQMVLGDPSIDVAAWQEALAGGPAADLAAFEAHVHADHLPHAVIIDCTASADVARLYPQWLAGGIHVVTANKKANTAGLTFYEQLKSAAREGGSHYLYEATVGAGLPVIQTIRDLRETGDRIRRIEGILSGTLSYLFNAWDGREPFSAVVRDAWRRGYTEPDPRDDLSGLDAARKLVILGREIGLSLTLDDVEVESLVPDHLAAGSPEDFVDGLDALDGAMAERLEACRARGCVLRYVGTLDADTGRGTVGLVELGGDHSLAHINLTDNVVRFITDRYNRNPLVVQGPGAGPAVTAGGVFADLLRICAYLGARL